LRSYGKGRPEERIKTGTTRGERGRKTTKERCVVAGERLWGGKRGEGGNKEASIKSKARDSHGGGRGLLRGKVGFCTGRAEVQRWNGKETAN